MNWDLLMIVLALYNCVTIPLTVAFPKIALSIISLNIIERIVDAHFIIDIILMFRTTYVNSKTNIMISDPKKIAENYVYSYRFPFDILASVPIELLLSVEAEFQENPDDVSAEDSNTLQLFGILKLIRIFRIGRIVTYMQLNANLKSGFKIFWLCFSLFIMVHWVACAWYVLISGKNNETWIPTKDLDFYYTNFYDEDIYYQYFVVFHYAVLTILGNECAPVNTA